MTTATVSTTATTSSLGLRRFTLLRHGAAVGLAAAAATTGLAAVAHGAGVSLEIGGEMIPLAAFAQLTFVFTLVGVGIAALCRRGRNAVLRFTQVTIGLTLLSLVPDLVADAASSTKLTLMATHVLAAAIVIPRLAGRLAE